MTLAVVSLHQPSPPAAAARCRREEVLPQDLGVSVGARVKTHPDRPPDHLGYPSMVDGPQPGVGTRPQMASRRHELRNKRKVLVHVLGLDVQRIHDINLGPKQALLVLAHLHCAQVVRRVDITSLPVTWHLLEVLLRKLPLARLIANIHQASSVLAVVPLGAVEGGHDGVVAAGALSVRAVATSGLR